MNQVEDYPFRYQITKRLELFSNDCLSIQDRKNKFSLVEMNENRSLLVLLAWVNSKPTHSYKYVDIYLEKGFDVLVVSTSIWQMMFPVTNIFGISSVLADFLNEHQSYQPLLIHGFSVGCLVWCYTEEKMLRNLYKYQNTIDRLAGCIWDSPPVGKEANMLSYLAFKKDSIFRVIGEQFIQFSLMLTYFIFYKHSKHGRYLLFNPAVELSKLILISKDDAISPYKINLEICEIWKSKGVQVNYKLWEKSGHVSHLLFHREEYLKQINLFLISIGLANITKKQKTAFIVSQKSINRIYCHY